jgi:DNA modification methylase
MVNLHDESGTALASIQRNPQNPRTIEKAKLERLKKSILAFPRMLELRPIVVDENSMALGGNMRLLALEELGFTHVPEAWIRCVTDLTEEQKSMFLIKDNLSYGEWEYDLLQDLWTPEELESWDLELPDMHIEAEVAEDNFIPAAEIKTYILPGDLMCLGPHRLLCGDATSATDVQKLMGDNRPVLMVTDPPYGVEYDPTWRHRAGINNSGRQGPVENDHRVDWTQAYKLFQGNVVYLWHGDRHAAQVSDNLAAAGFDIVAQIIWNKQQMVFGRGDYHWKHEPCWYAVRKGKKHNWGGGRKQTTVWDIDNLLSKKDKDSQSFHGTQKPVECMARPIRNNTKPGDHVYDPFLGSGTTVVAAQQLSRICLGLEIDPKYCQVIVDRFRRLYPELPVLINGQPYTQQP